MSLQLAAQHLASRGRGPDTMLVHMAPSEVKSLQEVAKAHGGSLTVNPDTGLPEAGFLSSILPMVAGVGLTALSGGTLTPVMAGLLTGGGTALATGNLQKGLMAGLGAYGGAGLGAGLAGAGAVQGLNAASLEAAAAGQAEVARQMADPAMRQAIESGILKPQDVINSAAEFGSNQMTPAARAALVKPSGASTFDNMISGLKGLGNEAGRDEFMKQIGGAKGLFKSGYAAALPLMMAQSSQGARPPSSTGSSYSSEYVPGYTGAPPSSNSSETLFMNPRYIRRYADGGDTGMTGQSDAYYRYLMGLAPMPVAYTAPAATQVDVAPISKAVTNPMSFYEQALSRLTPEQLATHNAYLAANRIDNMGPGAPNPAETNPTSVMNSFNENGLPNGFVTALLPIANALNITSPQQGALSGLPALITGNPFPMIGGAILGNAAQIGQMTGFSNIAESSMNQVGPELGGMSVQEGMLAGLDTVPSDPGATTSPVDPGSAEPGALATPVDPGNAVGTNIGLIDANIGIDTSGFGGIDAGVAADVAAATDAGISAGIDPGEFARGGLSSLAAFAQGGYNLGDYSDGGRLLRGPGDGVSDSIPASIADKRPARLADGEFVVPARIVSELGNGSTEAGARKLYAMMDRIQQGRSKTTGKGRVAVNSRSDRYLPA